MCYFSIVIIVCSIVCSCTGPFWHITTDEMPFNSYARYCLGNGIIRFIYGGNLGLYFCDKPGWWLPDLSRLAWGSLSYAGWALDNSSGLCLYVPWLTLWRQWLFIKCMMWLQVQLMIVWFACVTDIMNCTAVVVAKGMDISGAISPVMDVSGKIASG